MLANDLGYETLERPISVKELELAFRENRITEAFGAGTAAVLAPIQTINSRGIDYQLPRYHDESISTRIKQKLERIRLGLEDDVYGWNYIV